MSPRAATPPAAKIPVPDAPASDTLARGRDRGPDRLRAAALLYVAGFWHLNNYTGFLPWYHHPLCYRLAVLALGICVLLSGYFLAGAGRGIPEEKAGPGRPRSRFAFCLSFCLSFWRRRLWRILPAYLLAVAVFQGLGILGTSPLRAALMTGMLRPPAPLTLWFGAMMVMFYLLTPLLLWLVPRQGRLGPGLVCCAGLWLGLLGLCLLPLSGPDPRLVIYLPAFLAGLLLGRRPDLFAPPGRQGAVAGIAMGGALCGLGLSFLAGSGPADQSLWQTAWAGPGALALLLLCRHRAAGGAPMPPRPGSSVAGRIVFGRILAGRVTDLADRLVHLVAAGGYGLYLCHRPVYLLLLEGGTGLGLEGEAARFWLLLLTGLPLALALGWLIERGQVRAGAALQVIFRWQSVRRQSVRGQSVGGPVVRGRRGLSPAAARAAPSPAVPARPVHPAGAGPLAPQPGRSPP